MSTPGHFLSVGGPLPIIMILLKVQLHGIELILRFSPNYYILLYNIIRPHVMKAYYGTVTVIMCLCYCANVLFQLSDNL